jgi:hypothetical protein
MSHVEALSQWVSEVSKHMPHLSPSQARVLALYSFGMVVTQSCGLSSVAAFLSSLQQRQENSVRQQLREWNYESAAKRGSQRQAIEVSACFGALLRWVLSWWPTGEQRLALALDASNLRDRLTVLAISVVYRGCAIPVAWVIIPQCQKGSWRPHWEYLLTQLQDSVPPDWMVIVLADRGLYAKWLFTGIQKCGWHPFLRVNQQGLFRPSGQAAFSPLQTRVPIPGKAWSGTGTCFKTHAARLDCTLLACWQKGYTDPWLVLTDLSPEQAQVAWYGMRTWIEAGFKDIKRGGWHWEQSKMRYPARIERLWVVIAVATLWAVSVGALAEDNLPASSLPALPLTHIARRRPRRRSQPRLLSCFRRGIIKIIAALIAGEPLPLGRFLPITWPSIVHSSTSSPNTYP